MYICGVKEKGSNIIHFYMVSKFFQYPILNSLGFSPSTEQSILFLLFIIMPYDLELKFWSQTFQGSSPGSTSY